jgi:hypothetical protein
MSDPQTSAVKVNAPGLRGDLPKDSFSEPSFSGPFFLKARFGPKGAIAHVWHVLCNDMAPQNEPDGKESHSGITYSGGDGSAPEEAIAIEGASSHAAGIRAEKRRLTQLFGEEGAEWRLQEQSLFVDDAQVIDRFTVEKASGETETLYFEISDFYRAGD